MQAQVQQLAAGLGADMQGHWGTGYWKRDSQGRWRRHAHGGKKCRSAHTVPLRQVSQWRPQFRCSPCACLMMQQHECRCMHAMPSARRRHMPSGPAKPLCKRTDGLSGMDGEHHTDQETRPEGRWAHRCGNLRQHSTGALGRDGRAHGGTASAGSGERQAAAAGNPALARLLPAPSIMRPPPASVHAALEAPVLG